MHKKTHKVSRIFAFPWDIGRNIYLIFVPAFMQYCTITWKFLWFPTEKGSGCARLEPGVALQHTWLSSVRSVLRCWMRAKGSDPARPLSPCPEWDGAGSKAHKMTDHRGVPQPGTHTQAIAIGKKKQTTEENMMHYPCSSGQATSKQFTQTTQHTGGRAEAEQFCYPVQKHSCCHISSESHIQLQSSYSRFPPLLHALSTDGR